MAGYKLLSAGVVNENLIAILGVITSPDSGISLTEIEPELIKRLEKRYDYCQLIDERIDFFQNLLVLLRADEPENRIPALQHPALQERLKGIHWSAYKYAMLLSIFEKPHELAKINEILKTLPGLQNVNLTMSQTAFLDIICSDENVTYGYGLFEIACKAFWNVDDDDTEEDLQQDLTKAHDITDTNLIFTHADDFDSIEQVLKAFNILPRTYWSKIFSLPDMHTHFIFKFNNVYDAGDLVKIIDKQSDREFFLSIPNMLEAILKGLPLEERWEIIWLEDLYRDAFAQRIAKGHGDKMLALLGDCPLARDTIRNRAIIADVEAAIESGKEMAMNNSKDDTLESPDQSWDDESDEQDSTASYDITNLMAELDSTDVEQWTTIPNLPLLPNLIQNDFDTTFDELERFSNEKIDALLARPNVLEAIYNGLSLKERWKWIALKEPYQKAFINCLAQGRGETILNLLGNCPFKNETPPEKAITMTVLAAAKQGFEKMYEENYGTRDLLYAQCRQWHFFSPPSETTHPFIAKLEKMLAPKMSVKQQ